MTDLLAPVGELSDNDIQPAQVALLFSSLRHPEKSKQSYDHHLQTLCDDVAQRYQDLRDNGAEDSLETKLAALKHIIADKHAYAGDEETYDNIDNADLMRVIDRRKGMPIALTLLYIHVGRAQGWSVDGLNFPGHVLCRIEQEGARLIFDPFDQCAVMSAPGLRALLKKVMGDKAELSASYYDVSTNRDLLVRLQNNIKLRQIDMGDYTEALDTIATMRAVAPDEYRLLLDAGVLYAKTGQQKAAIEMLENYIARTPLAQEKMEAQSILNHLRDSLN